MDNYNWAKHFRELFHDGLDAYRDGKRDADSMFDANHRALLNDIGASAQEIFDFVEDSFRGDPDFETTLLVTAVRRDYFLVIQNGKRSSRRIALHTLPNGDQQLGGVEWLPRIIAKARAKLRGEMPPELMYCCGGDRAFLREHGIHPADFLREVWAAENDDQRILKYVSKYAAQRPKNLAPVACQVLPGGRVKC